ncbi:VanZ family protein [Microbacterium aquimaris]|uniref:VanZ family protein n=1 Tax=Microbacterium aquimaris TaxID=459816 RepID=A0ABU5N589_9MICO|nr:VanZ family protein [Microbacterium aquimaris]MDZ8161240.1 VanZ family protein [Microbacterium aquimaris]
MPPSPRDRPATERIVVPPRPPLPTRPPQSPNTPAADAAAGPPTPTPRPHVRRVAGRVLAGYLFTLTLIAFWPSPVDSGAGPLINVITRIIPVLTYARIEFGANILLFVPLGVLLTLILRDRALVLPIAIVLTLGIESVQGVLLDRRTPSELDIIANTAGACIGLLGVAVWRWWRRRGRPVGDSGDAAT